MKTIILLGQNSFSKRANYYLALLMGVIFIANAIQSFMTEDAGPFTITLGVLQLMFGVYYPVYIYTVFNPKSKYSPKAVIEDDSVTMKMGLFKKEQVVDLSTVEQIHFHLFRINFETSKGPIEFRYNTSDDASILLKRAVREAAESRNIPVIGG